MKTNYQLLLGHCHSLAVQTKKVIESEAITQMMDEKWAEVL